MPLGIGASARVADQHPTQLQVVLRSGVVELHRVLEKRHRVLPAPVLDQDPGVREVLLRQVTGVLFGLGPLAAGFFLQQAVVLGARGRVVQRVVGLSDLRKVVLEPGA